MQDLNEQSYNIKVTCQVNVNKSSATRLLLTGDDECLVRPHRVDVPHGDGGEHTTHLGLHQHGSAINAQIYAKQNALRRRECDREHSINSMFVRTSRDPLERYNLIYS